MLGRSYKPDNYLFQHCPLPNSRFMRFLAESERLADEICSACPAIERLACRMNTSCLA
jgi:hypothetical protein